MMMLSAAAAALAARMSGNDVRFESVSTDSRSIARGALFVALRGERFDGHDYLEAARAAGAVAAMVDAASESRAVASGLPLLIVDDAKLALGALAAHWRRRFAIPVILIVGSNGKTTVKEMIAACLRAHYGETQVLATVGNLNNDIGLPLTLLTLRDTHRVAAIEAGMNHPGETDYLARIAQPTIALVNNAQREHQEFMRSVDDVAHEHAAAFAALPADGVAIVNADDAYAGYWRIVAGTRRVRDFGLDHPAAVSAVCRLGEFGAELEVSAPEGRVKVALQVAGLHNSRNAVAAIAASTAAGASLESAARGLEAFRAVKGRLQKKAGRAGATIIDDTYNANPDSVLAAIDVLAGAAGPKILILGDMGEVGEHGPEFHQEVGRHARSRGIDRLLALGDLAQKSAQAFGDGGEAFTAADVCAARAVALLASNTTVLVKGSRFMRMERIVDALVEKESACC